MIGAVRPVWAVDRTRQTIRFEAAADEGAAVVACVIPGRHGGVAAAALMAERDGNEPRLQGGKVMPMHPVAFTIRRAAAAAAGHGRGAARRRDEQEALQHLLAHRCAETAR